MNNDPSIAELCSEWNDFDLTDMYRRCRSILADRDEWSIDTLVATDAALAAIVAELDRRGLGAIAGKEK